MNAILRNDWDSLIEVQGGPCASLYVAFDPIGHEGLGDPLRLKKMVEHAERQLLDRGYGKQDVTDLLKPAYEFPNSSTWAKRGKGFAILLGPGTSRFVSLVRPVQDEAWGDNHLHLRPLLPYVIASEGFYLLALSENEVRLYEGNASELNALNVAGLPKNLDDAVQIELPDRGSQTHSALAGGHGRSGAIFHGHGGKADTTKISRHEYLQHVYSAVERQWKQKQLPLVLAMVSEDVPEWRRVAGGVQTFEEFVAGNPDYTSMTELHERAWPIVVAAGASERQAAYDHLASAKGSPLAIVGLSQVLPAAVAGRIDTLFVDCRNPMGGRFDRASGEVVVQHSFSGEHRVDLLEEAIRETVLHRGKVFALESHGELPIACEALLRY